MSRFRKRDFLPVNRSGQCVSILPFPLCRRHVLQRLVKPPMVVVVVSSHSKAASCKDAEGNDRDGSTVMLIGAYESMGDISGGCFSLVLAGKSGVTLGYILADPFLGLDRLLLLA